jgi:hypothetical protein
MHCNFARNIKGLALSLIAAALVGCGGSSTPPAPVGEMSTQDLNQATQFVAASPADAEALVKAVEKTVAHQDVNAFNALIDENRMVDRILAGLDLKQGFRNGFMQGMKEGGGLSSLSNEIIGTVQNGGDYAFVRMVKHEDEVRPLFRLVLPESAGINYHELVVSVDANKQPRIADIHVHLSGEMLSQSIRRLVLPAVAAENAGILARLSGAESEYMKHIEKMKEINTLSKAEKYQEAMALFASLPEAMQKDKTVLLSKLVVAQNVSDTEYSKVIQDLERYFPNDTSRDFRALDLLIIQGKHEELLKTVDRLLQMLQDPYLNTLKVDTLLTLNRIEDARKAISEARAATPDRIDVYWVEVSMQLKAKDHAATAALLDEIGEKFGMTFNDLATVPEYAEFAASEIGKEWISRQAATPDAQPISPELPATPESAKPQ